MISKTTQTQTKSTIPCTCLLHYHCKIINNLHEHCFFSFLSNFFGSKIVHVIKRQNWKKNSCLPLNSSESITCSPQSLKNYSHTFGPLCKNFFKAIHGERHVSRLVFQTCLLIKNKFCSILIFGMAKIPCSMICHNFVKYKSYFICNDHHISRWSRF